MSKLKAPFFILWLAIVGLAPGSARSELWINEILFNPPGTPDSPNEYIELRGTPNLVLPAGTFLVCVEGDTNSNPGTIQNIFDLSGKSVGGNGFLVLLQKTNSYAFSPNATVLVNTDSGSGWGSGSSSSIGHRGESGQTEFENGSCTFFLIQTTNVPVIGVDIDADNNGVPDGSAFASWTILDSIGVLDNDGLGDIAYGAVNFRRNTAAMASGIVIPVGFTPGYIGRAGNTNGSTATAWVAADSLAGVAPNWALGSSGNTYPSSFAGALLNHIGGPNFGAPAIPGVIVLQSNGSTDVVEGAGTDSYTVSLNTVPSGSVTVQITTTSQIQISTNNGVTFSSANTLTFTTTVPRTILVRALDDNVLDTSPHLGFIRHAITATGDAVHYPTNSILPTVTVGIIENDKLLLSELKVNPPGTNDAPNEFIEVRGAPGLLLTNVYLLAIEGNFANNPGIANVVVNLTSARLGSSGLLLLVASGHPYSIPDGTTVINVPQFNTPGGALENGTISFLLVSSPAPILEGTDLDAGDNGILEGLPDGITILDAVGWSDGGAGDVVYGGVLLTQSSGTPDAATRFSYNSTPLSAAAWFNGDLAGATGESLVYDNANISSNFPFGAGLTPGVFNNFPPSISPLEPISGVIGDLSNPSIEFTVNDAETDPQILIVTATSSNPLVVPDANLTITTGTGGRRTLSISPIGVGRRFQW